MKTLNTYRPNIYSKLIVRTVLEPEQCNGTEGLLKEKYSMRSLTEISKSQNIIVAKSK